MKLFRIYTHEKGGFSKYIEAETMKKAIEIYEEKYISYWSIPYRIDFIENLGEIIK